MSEAIEDPEVEHNSCFSERGPAKNNYSFDKPAVIVIRILSFTLFNKIVKKHN